MQLDKDACWRALATHDARFDGRFYVGVRSTRVYCRPVCTVRLPRRENCRFYPSAAAAEAAGHRPCLRCRPELAPGFSAVDASARIAKAAVALIEDGFLEGHSIDALAGRIGVTGRHLRRVFDAELGVSPVAYAQTQRLLLAKHLLTDTSLPVVDVAFASGFSSVRRMNALFQARYRMPPSRLRERAAPQRADRLRFALGYRPPYAWDAVLDFLGSRAIPGVEQREAMCFHRMLAIRHRGDLQVGRVEIVPDPLRNTVSVLMDPVFARAVPQVLAKVRQVFDLGCDPAQVGAALGPLAGALPGLRVPGTFEGFEAALRAIVGQQISVRAMVTLLGRLAARFGTSLSTAVQGEPDGIAVAFPEPQQIASLPVEAVAAIGMPAARARTVVTLARAMVDGLELSPGVDVATTMDRLQSIPGIGPWTAQYIAMRALAWPDAFLASDLGVRRRFDNLSSARIEAHAEAWRPWRAYAMLHLWNGATP